MSGRLLNLFLFLYCCTLAPSCRHSHQSEGLKEGDLLFHQLKGDDLCNAIEAVTEGVEGKEFSHGAIVLKINDTLNVVEAIGDKVQVNSLKTFFARSGDTSSIKNITVASVNGEFQPLLKQATSFARQQIGEPYDNEFLLQNDKWYCSELLYHSFKEANHQSDFFELEPMTFKDPETKTNFPSWVAYYKKLNTEIPEGKKGIKSWAHFSFPQNSNH